MFTLTLKHTHTHTYTHVYMCHAISFMSYDVSHVEKFPISPEVMLSFFFYPEYEFWFFDFSRI